MSKNSDNKGDGQIATPLEPSKELTLDDILRPIDKGVYYGTGTYLVVKQNLERLITKEKLQSRIDEIGTIPLELGNQKVITYISGKQQSIEDRYDELMKQLTDIKEGKE